jgi:hypothetical protein
MLSLAAGATQSCVWSCHNCTTYQWAAMCCIGLGFAPQVPAGTRPSLFGSSFVKQPGWYGQRYCASATVCSEEWGRERLLSYPKPSYKCCKYSQAVLHVLQAGLHVLQAVQHMKNCCSTQPPVLCAVCPDAALETAVARVSCRQLLLVAEGIGRLFAWSRQTRTASVLLALSLALLFCCWLCSG